MAAQPVPSNSPQPQVEPVKALSDQLHAMTENLPDWLQPSAQFVSENPLSGAVAIALLFWLFAFLFRWVILANLEHFASRTNNLLDNVFFTHLRRPVFTTILFFGLMLAVTVARLPFGTDLFLSALASVIVVSWMLGGMKLSGDVLSYFNNRRDIEWVEPRTIPAIDLVIKLTCILIGSYALLLIWGINPLGWLASAGIVGIAVGFAAKDTLANLFAGFFIVADAPYKIGDYINLDSGERGQVTHIGMRSTRLLTRDDVEITVPNGVMGNAKITNESGGRHQKVRIRTRVGVAYGSDLDRVVEVLKSVGESHDQVCAEPEPRVRMREFAPSSQVFELLCWIEHPEQRGRVRHDLYLAIDRAFRESGVTIPFPQTDLHIRQMPSND